MEKKINLVELLKNCPKGMELDCTMYEGAELDCVTNDKGYPIKIIIKDNIAGDIAISLTKEGCYNMLHNPKCVIFPKGKTSWEGFVPPCQFKDGDIVYVKTTRQNEYITIFKEIADNHFYKYACLANQYFSIDKCAVCHLVSVDIMRLATEAETEKLFQAIKDRGYKWNAETKTLEKLVEPKFKVGDRIRSVISLSYYTIIGIEDDQYVIQPDEPEKFPYHIDFDLEINYELVPKFDITTLKPFESKVLVRDKNTDEWRGHFFSHYDSNSDRPYVCIGVEGINEYKRCIPYKDNEHLLGKTDDCSSFYKTWE